MDKNASVSVLLPSYLRTEMWMGLAEAWDVIREEKSLPAIDAIAMLRQLWLSDFDTASNLKGYSQTIAQQVAEGKLLSAEDWDVYDNRTEALRLIRLGLPVVDPAVLQSQAGIPDLSNSPLHRIVQNISMFWYEKGRHTFMDFLNYVLGTDVRMVNLWTTDYVTFYEEGEPIIGVPVWGGGPWYPTTHVRLDISNQPNITAQTLVQLVSLFFDIANYNLVLESVSRKEWWQIVDDLGEAGPISKTQAAPCNIVALGRVEQRVDYFNPAPFCPTPAVVIPIFQPTAVIGTPYSSTIAVSNATALLSFVVPAGLTASLSGNTVTVSGTPTATGAVTVLLSLRNECGTAVPFNMPNIAAGTITVQAIAPAIVANPVIPSSVLVGSPITRVSDASFTGSPAPTLTYAWWLDGVNTGHTDPTTLPASFTTVSNYLKNVQLRVTATNVGGSVTAVSNMCLISAAQPVIMTHPSIESVVDVGDTINTLVQGVFSGVPTPTVTRRWFKDGVVFAGQTGLDLANVTAGQYYLEWRAENAAGISIANTNTCVVAPTVCPLPTVTTGLGAANATPGAFFSQNVVIANCTSVSNITGMPSWMTATPTVVGTNLHVTFSGTVPNYSVPTSYTLTDLRDNYDGNRGGYGNPIGWTIKPNGQIVAIHSGLTSTWVSGAPVGTMYVRVTLLSHVLDPSDASVPLSYGNLTLGVWQQVTADKTMYHTGLNDYIAGSATTTWRIEVSENGSTVLGTGTLIAQHINQASTAP